MKIDGLTPYHAKYLAAKVLRDLPQDNPERLSAVLYDADIDVFPHQLSAANFAFNNPLTKGVILSDETGLGKTIEAGIVMSWFVSKGKKNFLLIAPTADIAMWHITLTTKFHQNCEIVTDDTFGEYRRKKIKKPFEKQKIFITTYKVAHNNHEELEKVDWDMVIVDEAHRMKDIYDLKSVIGESIASIVGNNKVILITANPFQSTMKRLFPLGILVDDFIFGDRRSFNYQFVSITDDIDYKDLSGRLSRVMKRTKVSRAVGYIENAKRVEIPIIFEGYAKEVDFIIAMINYYIGGNKYGIPSEKASIQALGLFVQLTLSPKIAMDGIQLIDDGLVKLLETGDQELVEAFVAKGFTEDVELLEWIQEEWFQKSDMVKIENDINDHARKVINAERETLLLLREYALEVRTDSRFEALLDGLKRALRRVSKVKGKKKIVIYTQSKQSQKYLAFLLKEEGYKGVYSVNKLNDNYQAQVIYEKFLSEKEYEHLVTGDEFVDRRTAIVKDFEKNGTILVATDLGLQDQSVEGCTIAVNYDLPFDPYLSEKRLSKLNGYIGNRTLYVVNIVNEANEFELWNYDTQAELFNIFNGMYGRSDLSIGSIGSGVDFSMNIFGYYMRHHTINLVETAFRKIKIQILEANNSSMKGYYRQLTEKSAAKDRSEWAQLQKQHKQSLKDIRASILKVAGIVIGKHGSVTSRGIGFVRIKSKPFRMKSEDLGEYTLDELNLSGREKLYVTKGIGKKLFQVALRLKLPVRILKFKFRSVSPRLQSLKPMKGKSGVLNAKLVSVTGLQKEEYIVFSGFTDEGEIVTQEQGHDLFSLKANDLGPVRISSVNSKSIRRVFQENKDFLVNSLVERDSGYIREVGESIDKWIADRVLVHRKDLRLIMTQKRKLHRRWINSSQGRKKAKLENALLEVGVFRRKKRRYIRRVQISGQEEKERIIARLSRQSQHEVKSKDLFTIRWELR